MSELRRLPPAEAHKLLALAAMTLVLKQHRQRDVEMIRLDGTEITEETMRATARRILVEKRRARGIDEYDLSDLIEHGREPGQ